MHEPFCGEVFKCLSMHVPFSVVQYLSVFKYECIFLVVKCLCV